MTDDLFDEPDFDNPAHAEIRDLLGSARVDTPIPAEVAARLDATLADLTSGLPAPVVEDEPSPTVVPLRRRSRLGPRLLAAAAVIVVAGAGAVGLGQVVQNTSGSDDKAGTATALDSGAGTVAPEASAPTTTPSDETKGLDSIKDSLAYAAAAAGRIPVLNSSDFALGDLNLQTSARLYALTKDADGRVENRRTPAPSAVEPGTGADTSTNGTLARAQLQAATKAGTCTPPELDGVSSYALVLDGEPAVLVLHPASSGIRLVEAWSCDGTKVLAFTTIPA